MNTKGDTGERGETGAQGARGESGSSVRNPAIWALAFALVLCFSLLAVGVHRDSQAAAEAHTTLCSLQADTNQRLKQSRDFLAKFHGQALTVGGVRYTRSEIVRSEQGLQAQANALKDASC